MTDTPQMHDSEDQPQGASHGLPIVRLRPKAEARAIRHGFPWVYADELVTDRRTGKIPAGGFAVLEDADRREMGLVTVNTASKIICRMMDRDISAVIDADWIAARLTKAPTATDMGFALGPRINAGGRVGKSDLGVRLLTTSDPQEAADISQELNRLNEERRAIEAGVLDEPDGGGEGARGSHERSGRPSSEDSFAEEVFAARIWRPSRRM